MTNVSDGDARRTGPALEAMYQLVKWLIPALGRFPRRQKFLLGDRVQSTALAGLETLVEATFTRSRGPLLERANVDLDKLRLLMRLSKELGYLDARRYEASSEGLYPVLSVTLFRRGFLGLFLIERGSICHIDPSSSES